VINNAPAQILKPMIVGRSKWRLAGLGILALFLFIALHLYLNSRQVQAWVLSRIKKNLVTQLGDVELGDRFSVDWIGRVTVGPLTLAGEKGPIFTVASATVRPAYRRLLTGRVDPAAITLDKVEIDIDRAQEAFKRLSENRRENSLDQSEQRALLDIDIWANEIHVQTAQAEVQKFLHVFDPLSGKFGLGRSATDWRVKGDLRFSEDGHSTFDLRRGREGRLKLKMNLEVPNIDQMFDEYEELPLTIKHGALLVDLDVDADQNFNHGTASSIAKMQKLQLDGERLDSNSVGPLDLSGGATVSWDRATRQIQLTKTKVGISGYAPLPLEVTGRLNLGLDPNIDIEAAIHKLDFPRLLRAVPPQLSPGDELPAMTGVISAQFGLKGPAFQPGHLELTAKLDLTYLHPSQSSSLILANSFEYRPARENGHDRTIVVGDKNPNFVPLAQIPPFLIGAVLLSEDAAFWSHRGFDFQEIKDSLVDAAEQRRFRGASTITQQLAKNLYFSREKTYARKIREAIATLTLEASLPKSRILEIYLNIIEWGPEIYGVGEAAQHYFGREAADVTPKQAAFLASIIPNPIKYYVYYRQGALSEVWEKRVHELLVKMRDRGVLNEEEFAQAKETPIVFAASTKVEN